jgi:geranylgeranyl pyrophosphate synthase
MILDSAGARQYAEGVAREYCDKSLAALAQVEIDPSAKEEFAQLAGFMIGREY